MNIRFHFEYLFDKSLMENRFDEKELDKITALSRSARESVLNDINSNKLGFSGIIDNEQLLDASMKLAEEFSSKYRNLVLVGIGGSALGPRALFKALRHPFHNFISNKKNERDMNLFFLENVDPDTFSTTFDILNYKDTAFVVITKSGSTVETMSQFMILRKNLIDKFGENGYRERMIAITDPQKGTLRNIVKSDRLCSLPVPENIGGRFSVFSPVGIFPAACCGINVKNLLKGASEMNKEILNSTPENDKALRFSQLMYIAHTVYKRNILIVMPYKDSLLDVAEWFQQLWAESLGKEKNIRQEIVNTGTTPVRSLGVIDQHSQLQLYIEGPQDKVVMIIGVNEFNNFVNIPETLREFPDISYLSNHSLNEIINLEKDATIHSLLNAKRPVFEVVLNKVNEENIGALMLFFEYATAYAGGLYQINAFDQPGVEHGKKLLYKALKKPGY